MTTARVWNWSARRCRGTTNATRNRRPFTPTTAESEASFRYTLAAKRPRSSTLLVDVATRPASTDGLICPVRIRPQRSAEPAKFVPARLGPRQGRKLLRPRLAHQLDEMLSERKKLSADVQSILDAQTEDLGRHCHTNRFYWSLLTSPPAPD